MIGRADRRTKVRARPKAWAAGRLTRNGPMQPPITPTPRVASGELYRRHHRDLQHSVTGAVRAPIELIEDACQTAWSIMLRARPDCQCAFCWLRTVAIHEAYRLMAIERQQTTLARL